jgi:hypothetical protein
VLGVLSMLAVGLVYVDLLQGKDCFQNASWTANSPELDTEGNITVSRLEPEKVFACIRNSRASLITGVAGVAARKGKSTHACRCFLVQALPATLCRKSRCPRNRTISRVIQGAAVSFYGLIQLYISRYAAGPGLGRSEDTYLFGVYSVHSTSLREYSLPAL